jgi:hypothetical protein
METLVVELLNKCYYGRSSREFLPVKSTTPQPVAIPAPVA